MITAQIESLTEALDDLKPHFPAHWEELGLFRDKMPLDPQYQIYLQRDALGEAVLATLREDGAIVGYWVGFVAPGLHYRQTLTATMDICYILPRLRGMQNGVLLFDAVKKELQRRGVKLWWNGSKNHKPIEVFFEAYGLERQEAYYALWLGD